MRTTSSLRIELPNLGGREERHALVVDDDADIRNLVAMTLTNAGYTVTTAATGQAALREIEQRLPDVVVLDVAMPGMSGFDVCTTLRLNARTQALPVIMLTARDHVMYESQGLMAGADVYMVKPFSPKALLARVENLLTYT